MIRLRVWANKQVMGWFGHEGGQYFFQYDEQWLQDEHAFVLAPQFAFQVESTAAKPSKRSLPTCCQKACHLRKY